MERRSTNVLGYTHFQYDVTAHVGSSHGVRLSGGSTGGTQLFDTYAIAANSTYDYYCGLRMASTDYLTGLASASNSVVITVEGEYYAA